MKYIPEEIVGKRIASVVLRKANQPDAFPQSQLFLIFDDGTSYEFWCSEDDIHPSGDLDVHDAVSVRTYMGDLMEVVREVPRAPEQKARRGARAV